MVNEFNTVYILLCVEWVAMGKWYWSLIKTDVKVGGWVAGRYSGSRWAWQWVAVCCGICGRGCSCGSAVSLSESLKWHALDNNTKSSSQLPCFPVPFPILHSPWGTTHCKSGNIHLKCNWNRQGQSVTWQQIAVCDSGGDNNNNDSGKSWGSYLTAGLHSQLVSRS